jgi:hypothetical protein
MTKSRETDDIVRYEDVHGFASDYLATYYSGDITDDERTVLRFLVENFPKVGHVKSILEVGCGPTVHHMIPAVPYTDSIVMSDFLQENLDSVMDWVSEREQAHDWTKLTEFVLELEGIAVCRETTVGRENQLRAKIKSVERCNLRSEAPLATKKLFPVVCCFYTTETVSVDLQQWREVMKHLASLVEPGGMLFMSALKQSTFYSLSPTRSLPTACLSESEFAEVLPVLGFKPSETIIKSRMLPDQEKEGLKGVLLICARKHRTHNEE